MDYKERYEKALEVMRQWIAPCHTPEQLEAMKKSVFPELKESEDEKIRKHIVKFIDEQYPTHGNLKEEKDKMLAYLEKQKEQKPNIELIQRSWYMEGYHDREFGKEPKWIIKTGESGPKHELNPRYGEYIKKEQKPAEWSEEDEKMRLEAIRVLVSGCERYRKESGCLPGWHKVISWLKSLRPQPKVELSEDVKKTLDEVSHILIGLNYKQVAKDYKQAIEKLLYSRPSWKPSEEQMEALNALNCHGDLSYVGQQNQLISLQKDLEKLKGGVTPMREIDE